MKKILLCLCLFVSACATYDVQEAMRPADRAIDSKLPNMEPIFEIGKASDTKSGDSDTASIQSNNHYATLFRREVEMNLINENGPIKGKLVLEPVFEKSTPSAWSIGIFFSYIPSLFGAPILGTTFEWELELNVLDKNGKRIARYLAQAKDTEYTALYYGYTNSYEAAALESYKKALDDIIKQVQADIPKLSAKLK